MAENFKSKHTISNPFGLPVSFHYKDDCIQCTKKALYNLYEINLIFKIKTDFYDDFKRKFIIIGLSYSIIEYWRSLVA